MATSLATLAAALLLAGAHRLRHRGHLGELSSAQSWNDRSRGQAHAQAKAMAADQRPVFTNHHLASDDRGRPAASRDPSRDSGGAES